MSNDAPFPATGLFSIGESAIDGKIKRKHPPLNLYPGEHYFPAQVSQSLEKTIPSYLYKEFEDDDDLQAFVDAYNALTQVYVDWFNDVQLPIYSEHTSDLLDWVGKGLYGIGRPTLFSTQPDSVGLIASDEIAAFEISDFQIINNINDIAAVNDDVYKRIITWHFYKGDGKQFSAPWLRRRVVRFLYGWYGTDYTDPTYNISLIFGPRRLGDGVTGFGLIAQDRVGEITIADVGGAPDRGEASLTVIIGNRLNKASDGMISQCEIGANEIAEVPITSTPLEVPPLARIFCEAVLTGTLEFPGKFKVFAHIGGIGVR